MTERLRDSSIDEVLTAPLSCPSPRYVSYEELSPVTDGTPTPLDPERVFITGEITYGDFTQRKLNERIDTACSIYEVSSDVRRILMNEVGDRALQIRMDHNTASMQRLAQEIARRGTPIDAAMREIIINARRGSADINELLRLIKEYPETISVEVYKFTKPLDETTMQAAIGYIERLAEKLRDEFKDAKTTTFLGDDAVVLSRYIHDDGIMVTKHLIAEAESADSRTQLVRKTTQIIRPALHSIGRDPRTFQTIMLRDGEEVTVSVHTLAVSAYFRAVDYHTREGYIPTVRPKMPLASYPAEVGIDSFSGDLPIQGDEAATAYRDAYRDASGANPRDHKYALNQLARSREDEMGGEVMSMSLAQILGSRAVSGHAKSEAWRRFGIRDQESGIIEGSTIVTKDQLLDAHTDPSTPLAPKDFDQLFALLLSLDRLDDK